MTAVFINFHDVGGIIYRIPSYLNFFSKIGHKRIVSMTDIQEHWIGLGLAPKKLQEIIDVGKLPATVEWHRFVAVACGKLADVYDRILKLKTKIFNYLCV